MRRATVPVTNFVIGSSRVIGRKRLESFGRGAIAPSFRMDGDKPMKISPARVWFVCPLACAVCVWPKPEGGCEARRPKPGGRSQGWVCVPIGLRRLDWVCVPRRLAPFACGLSQREGGQSQEAEAKDWTVCPLFVPAALSREGIGVLGRI